MIILDMNVQVDREIKKLKQDFLELTIGGAYAVPFKRSGTLMLRAIDKNFRN